MLESKLKALRRDYKENVQHKPKEEGKAKERDSFKYEVLGGTHLSLATKKLRAKNPDNQHFPGRMCRVYVGLTNEQAIYLGAMHQQSSMYQHDVSYREEARHYNHYCCGKYLKLNLYVQVIEKKISLKELKEEAELLKALSQVQDAIVKFFHVGTGRRL
ncbi:unnamed protein product [Porites evermanni]|uniref:Uncharacterized protein n=1 Tax=Porites evermanni TaxID=104178 RepID=A0ABN8SY94_9CNID|nr:unnamed protein product [Porites evermanni]